MLDSFAACLSEDSARRVVEFRIPDSVQQRFDELGERANEGLLSEEERSEYDALIDADNFLSIIKLRAKSRLPKVSVA